jgi:prepilin-type N-terminal cleavage/methylation domain-containing protein
MQLFIHRRHGFTLVELLVVIAIIGILVALLLPAIQAAREAGRRIQCSNNLKQIGLAIHNHVDVAQMLPTGGTTPWPNLWEHSDGGIPNAADRQGYSWAFQILPYFEKSQVYNRNVNEANWQNAVAEYFCPSRRRVTRQGDRVLMDYASATPAVNPNNIGFGTEGDLWQGEIWTVPNNRQWRGAIVRTPRGPGPNGTTNWSGNNSTRPAGFESLTDGSSNVLMVSEKRLNTQNYMIGDWHDDRGWTDGWDPDVVRCTCIPPLKDVAGSCGSPTNAQCVSGYEFGSAHPSGIQGVLGDGAVKTISWTIDPVMFNRLGDRQDRQPVNIQ